MTGTSIMTRICTSPYPIEKVGDFSYPHRYLYPINMGIPRQNRDRFGQYPQNGFICHLYVSMCVNRCLCECAGTCVPACVDECLCECMCIYY